MVYDLPSSFYTRLNISTLFITKGKRMTKKHFKELARILGSNMALSDLINDIADFCASENSYFQRQLFIDACEKHYQEAKQELEKAIS
jgi:Ca2+-binding EF-hand superfamily protein|tara:strand:+ start:215 stop:478 length:264 start_codon:yes stop_codon:yes gene_type:complete